MGCLFGEHPGGTGLFSFIGFRSERKPIFELLQLLKKNVRAKPSQFARVRGDKVIYFKQIQYPRIEDIENSEETLYDGWAGNFGSWVRGIRRGISGYSHYLFSLVQKFNTSRSGPAIQVKDSFDQGEHEPKEDYIEKDIKNFEDKVRSFRLEGSRVSVR